MLRSILFAVGMAVLLATCTIGGIEVGPAKGSLVVTGGEAAEHVIIWNLEDRDIVQHGSLSPIGGVAVIDENLEIDWFQVVRNADDELMVRVRATDVESSDDVIGYIACKYVRIVTPAEGLTGDQQECSDAGE